LDEAMAVRVKDSQDAAAALVVVDDVRGLDRARADRAAAILCLERRHTIRVMRERRPPA
jgi:hypothetical protein